MRNRFRLSLVAGLLLAGGVGLGQAAKGPTFDVASVRLSAPLDMGKLRAQMQAGQMPNFGPHVSAARAEYTYMALKELIAIAYDMKGYQVSGPDWMATERFDIVATMPAGASKDDAPKMLRALLEERFRLKARRDTEEQPVLGLVVGKGGAKLTEATSVPKPIDEDAPLNPGEMKMNTADGPVRVTPHPDGSATMNMGAKGVIQQKVDMQTQTVHLQSSAVTMAGFADMLTRMMQMGGGGGRQVVDMTGLKGHYQVEVDLSLMELMAAARSAGMGVPGGGPGGGGAAAMAGGTGGGAAGAPEASDPGGGGSSIFASVEKLGLKLEPRKAPVERVVVESVEKTPTEN